MNRIRNYAATVFSLFLLITAAYAQQPTQAPTHQYFAGPSLGMVYTGYTTVTGASPQTCNTTKCAVTTGTLTTAALTAATYTVNNSLVAANSVLSCDLAAYSGTFFTAGTPAIGSCTPGAGTITITFLNTHATVALNGTLTFHIIVMD